MKRHPRLPTLLVAALALSALPVPALAHGDAKPGRSAGHGEARNIEATPFGREGDPKQVTRTIRVDMTDAMRFTPAHLTVRRGETVRIVATNRGQVLHELVLGTPQELQKHAELMRKFPEMEHEEAYMTHVKPGKSGAIVWQFTTPGEFAYACLIPGHSEAGMVGTVSVK